MANRVQGHGWAGIAHGRGELDGHSSSHHWLDMLPRKWPDRFPSLYSSGPG